MFGNTISMAHKAMDFLWKKQEVIASNIANVDTPGYKNKNVAFEDIYRRRLQAASKTKNSATMRQAIEQADCLQYSWDS